LGATLKAIAKIRKIFGTSAPLNFNSKEQDFGLYWDSFKKSKLGQIYDSIPWDGLVKEFGLKQHHKGRSPVFSPQGKIALQFLKSYTGPFRQDVVGKDQCRLRVPVLLWGRGQRGRTHWEISSS
jgi:hypothetical protein